ncbi:unnamed protein product [Allacma fusca]|uniref:RNA helicase n=1 Tax=Allacma fusca TaxID=39272 RepID=A0A8J2KNG4_9HEXA|nr:unnamed protein product [Allacma fusca]
MKAKQAKRNKVWASKQKKKLSKNDGRNVPKGLEFNSEDRTSLGQGNIEEEHEDNLEWESNGNGQVEEDVHDERNGNEEDAGDYDDSISKKKKKSGGFQSMGLSHAMLKGITKRGYKVPTPIQRKTIPAIMEGRDVVAMARTGSGKTAAFLIPLFEKLTLSKYQIGETVKYPRALVLSPTRELATQTVKFFRELGKFLNLKVTQILGGDSMESQFSALNDKPDVVVATPGRFMHLCVEMELKLNGVEYVVFDEADRLFEMGFGEQINEILKRLPDNRQTVLFSATMPRVLVDFTKAGLHDPTLIRLDVDSKLPDRLSLTHLACRSEDKFAALLYLLKNEIDLERQTLVFVATKHHVELLHSVLDEAGISNCYIYSSLDAAARKISLGKFRNGKANVMIVTDIAARGIDIPILDNVINFHFPAKPKLFMHRVGRVARAGRSGTAISIVSPDEVAFLIDLHLFLGKPLKVNTSATDSQDGSVLIGRVPQDVIDEELGFYRNLINLKSELESLIKVARNGYAQYLKSRPSASSESNKRAKGIEFSKLPMHPMFDSSFQKDPMNDFIAQIHNYRPHSTIFEIGPKAGSEVHKIMQVKRSKDQSIVEKYRHEKSVNTISTLDAALPIPTKDDENFINYLPKDHHTETGLSVGSTFDKQVQDSVMDLTGDDSKVLRNQQNIQKWDRKKKKFIQAGNDNVKSKKIKTESGNWISASFKTDRYKSWQEKSKATQQMEADSDDDGDNFARKGVDPSRRRPAFSSRLMKAGKNEAAQKGRFKSEIKRPEQILKARKVKEAKQKKHNPKSGKKGGKSRSGGAGGGKGSSFGGFKGGKKGGKSSFSGKAKGGFTKKKK